MKAQAVELVVLVVIALVLGGNGLGQESDPVKFIVPEGRELKKHGNQNQHGNEDDDDDEDDDEEDDDDSEHGDCLKSKKFTAENETCSLWTAHCCEEGLSCLSKTGELSDGGYCVGEDSCDPSVPMFDGELWNCTEVIELVEGNETEAPTPKPTKKPRGPRRRKGNRRRRRGNGRPPQPTNNKKCVDMPVLMIGEECSTEDYGCCKKGSTCFALEDDNITVGECMKKCNKKKFNCTKVRPEEEPEDDDDDDDGNDDDDDEVEPDIEEEDDDDEDDDDDVEPDMEEEEEPDIDCMDGAIGANETCTSQTWSCCSDELSCFAIDDNVTEGLCLSECDEYMYNCTEISDDE